MKIVLILLFTFPIFSFCQKNNQPKNYISVGIFDHKSGLSAIGYSRSIFQNNQNEAFVGMGTMISLYTVSIGYKKYLIKSFFEAYSVASIQKIYGMGGGTNAGFISVGIEKRFGNFYLSTLGLI